MMNVLNSIVTWITAVAESYVGIGLSAVFLIGVIALVHKKSGADKSDHTNIGDLAAVGLTVIQLVTCLTSIARPNTVHYLVPYTIALCLYTATRLLSRWPVTTAKLSCRVLVGFGALLLVVTFPLQLSSIQLATKTFSPSALAGIRAALPLAGSSTKNDLVAVLLSILPFSLAGAAAQRRPNRYFWIVSVAVAAGISAVLMLSFSRSGYLGLSLLLLSFIGMAMGSKAISAARGAVVLICLCTVVFATIKFANAGNAIVEMVRGVSATSETRSTAGRVAIWRESASRVMEHPFVGTGGGTSGIVALKRLSYLDRPFAARCYSGPLEILTLSGIGGLALYAIVLLYPIIVTCRVRCDSCVMGPYPMFLVAGLIALMLHDLSHTSMVTNSVTIIMAWTTVASLQNITSRAISVGTRTCQPISHARLAYLTLGLSTVAFALSLHLSQAEKHYAAGRVSLADGDTRNARAEFQRAIRLEPRQSAFFAADGLAAVQEAMGTSLPSNLWSSLPPSTASNDQLLAVAEHDYEKAISMVKDDGSYWSNLAWVEVFRRKNDLAAGSFVHAIQVDPNDVMSRIGAGLLYERCKSKAGAIQQYAYAIALSPRILDSQFFVDLRARSPDLARVVVERSDELVKTFPASPIHLAAMAKLHAFGGAEELARTEYVKALTLLPNLSYASTNLGVLDLQRGDRGLARTEFERATFLDGTNRLATNMLASIDLEDGNSDKAKRLYERALLLSDSSVHAQRSWRLYHVRAPAPDDLVPQGLLSYLAPDIRPLNICDESWLAGLRQARVQTPDANRRRSSQEILCRTTRNRSMQTVESVLQRNLKVHSEAIRP